MKLTVILARRVVPAAFKIKIGRTIGFDQQVDAPVELRVEGHLVARGEVGVRDDRYGVQVTGRVEAKHPAPEAGALEVVLAEREIDADEVARLDLVEFEKSQHDTVDVYRHGRLVARGYIMPLGDRVGVKIVELVVS